MPAFAGAGRVVQQFSLVVDEVAFPTNAADASEAFGEGVCELPELRGDSQLTRLVNVTPPVANLDYRQSLREETGPVEGGRNDHLAGSVNVTPLARGARP